eukprot:TRINITY_DN56976_c0_g1_i1.p1 TRINITY_DN56976_c0_g1~~TRINITY_DN56976_c0_g1_i1.p1  ORF type:complete len:412 (+),score=14.82 TRINITY_DN56976_c0_g1_i1:54-1238(+)
MVLSTFASPQDRARNFSARGGQARLLPLNESVRLQELVTKLSNASADIRLRALVDLRGFARKSDGAALLADRLPAVTSRLRSQEEDDVRLEALNVLRCLAENGQALAVGMHAPSIVSCLQDDSPVICRKAAALFRIVAKGGGASFLARYALSLVECCERTTLTAPLEALEALADLGEACAVVKVASNLSSILLSTHSQNRTAVCHVLSAIIRSGTRVSHLVCENRSSGGTGATLLESLLVTIRDDKDHETKKAAIETVHAEVLLDTDVVKVLKSEHDSLLRQCRVVLQLNRSHGAYNLFLRILGTEVEEEQEDEEGIIFCCSICLGSDRKEKGGPRQLPCGHTFHANCIEGWFYRKRTCPICRAADSRAPAEQSLSPSFRTSARASLPPLPRAP